MELTGVFLFIFTMLFGWAALIGGATFFGVRAMKRRLLGEGSKSSTALLPAAAHKGCPVREKEILRKMERRLVTAQQQCQQALDTRLTSELARARVAPPLDEAYEQISSEIESIYAFCARNDLVGTYKKAKSSTSAQDIYLGAYERDLAKVQAAIEKTEECLSAYERTVATLEVSSVETDINSDFDAAIEMLVELQDELPRYSLEDSI